MQSDKLKQMFTELLLINMKGRSDFISLLEGALEYLTPDQLFSSCLDARYKGWADRILNKR